MTDVRLQLYKEEEREAAAKEGRVGFRAHAVITAIVAVALVVVNITLLPEFPWSVFAVAGMLIGLWFHWYFGVLRGDEMLRRHQDEIERHIDERRAA